MRESDWKGFETEFYRHNEWRWHLLKKTEIRRMEFHLCGWVDFWIKLLGFELFWWIWGILNWGGLFLLWKLTRCGARFHEIRPEDTNPRLIYVMCHSGYVEMHLYLRNSSLLLLLSKMQSKHQISPHTHKNSNKTSSISQKISSTQKFLFPLTKTKKLTVRSCQDTKNRKI